MREPGREPSNARDPRHTASIISGTTGTAHRVDGLSARRDAAPDPLTPRRRLVSAPSVAPALRPRSEEHTSELQSLMRISYAVFCLKKKTHETTTKSPRQTD